MWRHVFERCLGLTEGSPWSVIPSFEKGILKTVNESFDRDTAGAVAGALLGAYWGELGIPEKWRTGVEKADPIVKLADAMIEASENQPSVV
jgi:ADP-ribosylglycohydrolase